MDYWREFASLIYFVRRFARLRIALAGSLVRDDKVLGNEASVSDPTSPSPRTERSGDPGSMRRSFSATGGCAAHKHRMNDGRASPRSVPDHDSGRGRHGATRSPFLLGERPKVIPWRRTGRRGSCRCNEASTRLGRRCQAVPPSCSPSSEGETSIRTLRPFLLPAPDRASSSLFSRGQT